MNTTDESLLPPEPEALAVAPGVRIPVSEIELRGITGGGPGGQHVNRSATRVELRWNLRASSALTEPQRSRVSQKLGTRLDGDGTIRIVAGEYRSQLQNRRAALERLASILARALVVQAPRKATRPTRASVERRLDEKKKRGDTKRGRRFDGSE
jgi:ribosome-associated protein